MEVYKYKGIEYPIQEGKKGGKFIIANTGKKVYLKSENHREQKEVTPPEIKNYKYVAWFDVRNKNGELVDDFKEWCISSSQTAAFNYFCSEHPNINPNDITIISEEEA